MRSRQKCLALALALLGGSQLVHGLRDTQDMFQEDPKDTVEDLLAHVRIKSAGISEALERAFRAARRTQAEHVKDEPDSTKNMIKHTNKVERGSRAEEAEPKSNSAKHDTKRSKKAEKLEAQEEEQQKESKPESSKHDVKGSSKAETKGEKTKQSKEDTMEKEKTAGNHKPARALQLVNDGSATSGSSSAEAEARSNASLADSEAHRRDGAADAGARLGKADHKRLQLSAHTLAASRCGEWPTTAAFSCDRRHQNWVKLDNYTGEHSCRVLCGLRTEDTGELCCYVSATAGCWMKPGSQAFQFGLGGGRSVTCSQGRGLAQGSVLVSGKATSHAAKTPDIPAISPKS